MQDYFSSSIINKSEGQNLFRFRTRMALFAANFKNGANNLECPVCEVRNSLDSESHNLKCEKMTKLLPEVIDKDIKNIYSDNVELMKETITVLTKVMDIRSNLMSQLVAQVQ